MSYIRPAVEMPLFVDSDGRVIPYGDRWGCQSPPSAGYSRISHPERFAPVLTVARHLIDHLAREYAVDVTREGSRTRLEPTGPSMTFELDDVHHLVRVTAGPVAESTFPICGCDACDESLDFVCDELERLVFAVVQGRFSQRVQGRWLVTSSPGGHSRSRLDRRERKRVRGALQHLDWQPWPKRV
ncbi:MAG: DUF6226 family protein [Candidatus Nanopelagicales bacterium]|nr:hypothetical protein [Micrococcales bacterium]